MIISVRNEALLLLKLILQIFKGLELKFLLHTKLNKK